MLRRCFAAVAACLLTSVALPARQLEPRGITEIDLLAFTWVADAQISPDGSTIAFVKVVVNERGKPLRNRHLRRAGRRWPAAAAADLGRARHLAALVARRENAGLRPGR
jgi:hypothetical protein